MQETTRRIRAQVDGRVQGVGFRYFVQRAAADCGVTGWVRNRWDGSVEVVAEGEEAALNRLLLQIRKGPAGSNVTDLDLAWEDSTGEYSRFMIRQTG